MHNFCIAINEVLVNMAELNFEMFQNYLLKMTDLLTIETAALIDERPRFAHSVLILADNGPSPGERFKVNYFKTIL